MLADIFHKIATMEQEEYPYHPRPSLAGPERCIRQMVYHGMNMPRKPMPGRTLHVFDDGVFHEELVKDWVRKSAFSIHSEQMKVDCGEQDGIHLVGHIDGVITDMLEIDRLLEVKSCNHFSHQRYWTGAIPLDYVTQCALYMKGLQEVNPDLTEALLLCKNKNTSAYLEFLMEYNNKTDTMSFKNRANSQGEVVEMKDKIENICHDAFEKFAKVQEYVEKKTLPKRPYEMDSWRCNYCAWGSLCWENYEHEFNELKTDAILPDEFGDMVRYHQEVSAQIKDMNKERDEIKGKIKQAMKDADAREGRAGEYLCKLTLQNYTKWDESKIPENIVKQAKITTMSDRLTIKNLEKKG